jgi:hypothetical protein
MNWCRSGIVKRSRKEWWRPSGFSPATWLLAGNKRRDEIDESEAIDLPGIQIVSGDQLKHIDDAAKVECVLKNAQLQSVATWRPLPRAQSVPRSVQHHSEPSGKHLAVQTFLPNCDGLSAIRGQQLARNVNHFCLQKAARFCTLRTAN